MNEEKNSERSCSMEGNKGFVKVSSFLPSFLSSDYRPHPLPCHPSLFFSSLLLPFFLLFLLLFFISSPIELYTIGNVLLLLAAIYFTYTLYIHHIHGGLMLLRYVFLKRLMVRKGKIRILQPHSAA